MLNIPIDFHMEFLKDMWGFLRKYRKYWLVPLIIMLLLLGLIIILAGGSAVTPFIYTLF